MVSFTSPTNQSLFTYDGYWRCVQIIEKQNGVPVVTNTFLWCGAGLCEQRDLTGGTVVKRFFGEGEQISGANYFFTRDHLGSVREMTDNTGAIRARYDYDPYGRQTKLQGDLAADFGYAGMYYHPASGLNLTYFRAYDPNLGRWPSRDPIGEAGGINLYDYVANNPINRIDPFGLRDWSCGETQGFLNQAKEEGFLEAFFNHSQYGLYGKNTGAFDFGQNPDFAGDTFDVGGETLSASQFGNYIAGYGSEYAGGSIGYSAARLMGIVYDKGLDKDSVPDIDKGADRAKKEMQSNGSNGSSGSGCPCN
jgi:RHS repeat-associated protein